MPKCLLFDCDGTLVDSEELCHVGLAIKFRELDVTLEPAELTKRFRGGNLENILEILCEEHNVTLPENFIPSYREVVARIFEKDLKPVPGIKEALDKLSGVMAVVSNAPLKKVKHSLSLCGLSEYFGDKLYSSYDIGIWKPDPGLYLHAVKDLGFKASECIVIEDSQAGVGGAIRAGIKTLFYNPLGEESEYPEAISFSSMSELPGLIEKLDEEQVLKENNKKENPEEVEESGMTNAEILESIRAIDEKKKKSLSPWLILVISAIAFTSAGIINWDMEFVLFLLVAIFIHELGHLLAMKIFKYKNLKMLFLPFIGGVASGKSDDQDGYKIAMISIFGPLVGMLSCFLAVLLWYFTKEEVFIRFASLSLFLNVFNLLPLIPLDGGHFFNETLFSRFPKAEYVYKVFAILGLGFMAYEFEIWFFWVIAFLMFAFLGTTYKMAKAVSNLRKKNIAGGDLTEEKVRIIRKEVRKANHFFETTKDGKNLPDAISTTWMKVNKVFPRIRTMVFLLFFYCVVSFGLSGLVVFTIVVTTGKNIFEPEGIEGMPPLHVAIITGDIEYVKNTPANSAEINGRDKLQSTPLHYAVRCDKPQILKILLEKGAKINAKNIYGGSPLHIAARKNLSSAIIKTLLDKGALVDAKENEGVTPLGIAAAGGQINAMEILIEYGANINAQDKQGWTPLHFAAINGRLVATKILLEKGAYKNATNSNKESPLDFAKLGNFEEVIKLLE